MKTNPMRAIITEIVKNHDPQAPTEFVPVVVSRRPKGTFQPVSGSEALKTQSSEPQIKNECSDMASNWKRFQDWSKTFWGDLVIGAVICTIGMVIGFLILWHLPAMWGY